MKTFETFQFPFDFWTNFINIFPKLINFTKFSPKLSGKFRKNFQKIEKFP